MSKAQSSFYSEADDELLVSYLDGELGSAERIQVERRLASDESFRKRMIGLQQSWELLDELPRAELDAELMASTLSMAVQEVISDSATFRQLRSSYLRRHFTILLTICCLAIGGFLTIAIPSWIRHTRMLSDLLVVQDLDLYRYADSVPFIRQLQREQVWLANRENTTSTAADRSLGQKAQEQLRKARSLPEIRDALKLFPNELRSQISKNRDQFQMLPAAEQRQFRQLHREFSHQPDFEQLFQTLVAYEEFLADLTPLQRATLTKKPSEERIAEIKKEVANRRSSPRMMPRDGLRREDYRLITFWVGGYLNNHEQEFLALLNEEQRARIERIEGPRFQAIQKMEMILKLLESEPGRQVPFPEPTKEEKRQLLERLSVRAVAEVERRLREHDNQMSPLIRDWFFQEIVKPRLDNPPFRGRERDWGPRGPIERQPGNGPPPLPHERAIHIPPDAQEPRRPEGFPVP